MRVLVTGAAGYLGSRLVTALLDRGHDVVGIDRGDCDLAKPQAFYDWLVHPCSSPIDVVVHLAATPGRLRCERDPDRALRDNVRATIEVAQACGELGVRLVYVSTSEVYGDHSGFIDETAQCNPKNIYGLTKLWGEQVCRTYAPDRLTIIRPSMPYGPGMPVGPESCALGNFLWNALHGQPSVVHIGTSRAWCYIDDLIDQMRVVVEEGNGVFNIGTTYVYTTRRVAELAYNMVLGSFPVTPGELYFVAPPAMITPVKLLSMRRVRSLPSYRTPHVSLDDGMQLTLDDMRQRIADQQVA